MASECEQKGRGRILLPQGRVGCEERKHTKARAWCPLLNSVHSLHQEESIHGNLKGAQSLIPDFCFKVSTWSKQSGCDNEGRGDVGVWRMPPGMAF